MDGGQDFIFYSTVERDYTIWIRLARDWSTIMFLFRRPEVQNIQQYIATSRICVEWKWVRNEDLKRFPWTVTCGQWLDGEEKRFRNAPLFTYTCPEVRLWGYCTIAGGIKYAKSLTSEFTRSKNWMALDLMVGRLVGRCAEVLNPAQNFTKCVASAKKKSGNDHDHYWALRKSSTLNLISEERN